MSAPGVERAQTALARALAPIAGPFALRSITSRRWASATFEGARHRLVLALEGADARERADRVQAELAETEIAIRGGFVADIGVEAQLEGETAVLAIEALTIADPIEAALNPATRRAG